jgi:RimJ/RimL family protein N-acetyltransferase
MAELTGPDGHAPKPLPLPVVTERLTLRGYREDDLEATLAYYALPEVARYMRQEAPAPRLVGQGRVVRHAGLRTAT